MDNKSLRENKSILYLIIFSSILLLMLLVFVPKRANAFSKERLINTFHVRVINFSMPFTETAASESYDEDEKTIKDVFLGIVGFDRRDPLSVLQKEVSYFKSKPRVHNVINDNLAKTDKKDSNEMEPVNPFSLNEENIERIAIEDGKTIEKDNKVVDSYNPDNVSKIDPSKVQVLIYHSHTIEAYKPYPKTHTLDDKYNVRGVGAELTKELEKYNINVIHDKTNHCTAYNSAYFRSGEALDKYLDKYGDFDLIIDLHRDSKQKKEEVTIKLNRENVAKYYFVVATGNPHYLKNKAVIDKILNISNKLFPGLVRGNGIYDKYNVGTVYFNQHKSNNAVCIEVGSVVNKVEEAKNSTKYLARIIAEYLNEKKANTE